jgi:ribonuclease P protein component
MISSDKIYLSGNSFFSYPFRLFYIKNDSCKNVVIISVPKKLFKKAVNRNLIRRRIKEAYRHHIINDNSVCKYDILIIYRSHDILDYRTIDNALRETLQKINGHIEKSN